MAGTTTGPATACWTSLGCLVHLTVTEPGALDAARALLEADLAALDAACSRFRPDSELAQLDQAAGQPVPVSPLLAEAVAVALRAAELTGGDVDPTVGEAIVAAGYDRDFTLIPADGPAVNLVVRAVLATVLAFVHSARSASTVRKSLTRPSGAAGRRPGQGPARSSRTAPPARPTAPAGSTRSPACTAR